MTKGERIKYLREAKGMTQDELAAKLGTIRQTIYKYEKNIVTNIPSDRVEALAKILETTPEYILGWDEKLKPTPSNTRIENQVLNILKDLNSEGKKKVLEYAEFIKYQGIYKNDYANEFVG